tara:strand:- start:3263 stop:3802 length:540 start_codon:yes stop_codon:yes gene_type:complete
MIKIRVGTSPEYLQEYIETLDMKKSLGGHFMIFNHKDMNVVVKVKERKIVAYSKSNFSDIVYNTQNRFFNYLVEHGVVEPETIRGSNVFGSLLAEYPENKEIKNLSEVVLYNIALFMIEELEYMENMKKLEIEREEELLEPSDKNSTELGEVPQETTKGSMQPYYPGYSYGLAGIYRYE